MPIGTALGLGIAGLSTIAGAAGKSLSQNTTYSVNAGNATYNEGVGSQGMMSAFGDLKNMVDAGPGAGAVSDATGATSDFASLLKQYAQNGAGPTAADMSSANTIAGQLFAPQQTALNQSFIDERNQANRQAALMGRSPDDPILQAKLATEQSRQSAMLNASQGAFATNYAMQQPFQRLGFAQQRAGVLQGLATQAMQNRQFLASMGEGIMNNERNFRLQTATRTSDTQQQSGGGLAGAITGGIAGLGSGINLANSLMNGGGFGGGYSDFSGAGGPVAPRFMASYSNPYFGKGNN